MRLPDGTILPSFLGVKSSNKIPSGQALSMSQPYLKVGRVISVYYPDDKGNLSKQFVEYDVLAEEFSGGNYNQVLHPRAKVISMSGSVADFSTYTLRKCAEPNNKDALITNGSIVVFLCVNGDTKQGVILGGFRSAQTEEKDLKSDGHHLEWEFNGINCLIDKDGQLTLTFRGATEDDGTSDNDNGGTYIQINKNGDVKVDDDNGQVITIDKNTKKITIESSGDIQIDASGTTKIGTSSSDENLVLGQKLTSALGALLTIFLTNATNIGVGNLGAGVPMSTGLLQDLTKWRLEWISNPTEPLLSSDKFTE